MAPGADKLMADVAKGEPNTRVHAVLPLEQEAYAKASTYNLTTEAAEKLSPEERTVRETEMAQAKAAMLAAAEDRHIVLLAEHEQALAELPAEQRAQWLLDRHNAIAAGITTEQRIRIEDAFAKLVPEQRMVWLSTTYKVILTSITPERHAELKNTTAERTAEQCVQWFSDKLRAERHRCYQAAGERVAGYSHILIAICDETKDDPDSGTDPGAKRILNIQLRGLTPGLSGSGAVSFADTGPVQLKPGGTEPSFKFLDPLDAVDAKGQRTPQDELNHEGPEKMRTVARSIDRYNKEELAQDTEPRALDEARKALEEGTSEKVRRRELGSASACVEGDVGRADRRQGRAGGLAERACVGQPDEDR